MDQERIEFTEARFALTIVICLLVAVGYIALHRLGGTGEAPPFETRPLVEQKPIVPDDSRVFDDDQPRVLPIDPQTPMIGTSQMPDRPAPIHRDDITPGTDSPDSATRSELR